MSAVKAKRPPVRLSEIVATSDVRLFGSLPELTEFGWVERHSKSVQPGDLFIAVEGERFDGHQFVVDAAEQGAAAALVRAPWAAEHHRSLGIPLLGVDDPVRALQRLAGRRRDELGVKVVGITGSIGKTSTKEIVAAVLGQRFRTYRSPGNMNSEIGLPLSLLEIEAGAEVAVLEMGGAYAMGELTLLSGIAKPDIAIVTNVHPVHLERMGSIEAIARTKAELVEALPPHGIAILNGDNLRVRAMAASAPGRVITYGLQSDNEIWADRVETDGLNGSTFRLHLAGETLHIKVPLVGGHAVELALAGIAAGHALGMHISEMLPGFEDVGIQVRLLVAPGPNGSSIIDDTYNASAPSVLSALGLLGEIPAGRRIAVLGDMRELGDHTEAQHRVVGRRAAEIADLLVTFGDLARIIADEARSAAAEVDGGGVHVTSFALDQRDDLVAFLLRELQVGDIALLKGSRGLHMEDIVEVLRSAANPSLRSGHGS